MTREELKEDVTNIIKQIVQEEIIGSYHGLDCYYEDNELSEEEIEYIMKLKVIDITLSE